MQRELSASAEQQDPAEGGISEWLRPPSPKVSPPKGISSSKGISISEATP